LSTENGILIEVMPVDAGGILDQVGIIDILKSPITITDTRYTPCGMANGTGYELA
jgi:hypothetical protein